LKGHLYRFLLCSQNVDNFMNKQTGEKKGVRSKPAPLKSISKTVKRSSAKEILHSALRAADVPYAKAKEISGTGHGATHISIEQQRDKALKALDITLESQFKTLKNIRNSKMACNSDKIHAVKVINSMVPGWTAPEQVQMQHTGVFMELSGLSSRELAELAEMLQIEQRG
jgi:hypothetical protein